MEFKISKNINCIFCCHADVSYNLYRHFFMEIQDTYDIRKISKRPGMQKNIKYAGE